MIEIYELDSSSKKIEKVNRGLRTASRSSLRPTRIIVFVLYTTTDTLLIAAPIHRVRTTRMSSNIDVTETLDVQGQNCPMPVIKTKGAMDDLSPGEVLEVVATDSGSMSDIAGWADSTDGVELLDQVEGDGVYTHYVRRTE
jgi:TusA-related sulfurtransferase